MAIAIGQPPVPTWIRYWLAISALVVMWDAGFCLLRPYSMEGGLLFPLFSPYKLYGSVSRSTSFQTNMHNVMCSQTGIP